MQRVMENIRGCEVKPTTTWTEREGKGNGEKRFLRPSCIVSAQFLRSLLDMEAKMDGDWILVCMIPERTCDTA